MEPTENSKEELKGNAEVGASSKPESFQSFLDTLGVNAAFKKSVAKDRLVYPTVLQSRLIPLLLQGQRRVLVKYEDQSGIKLGVFLPIFDSLLTYQKERREEKTPLAIVLTHNKKRANELKEFANNLATFCKESLKVQTITKADEVNLKALPNVLITNPKALLSLLSNKTFTSSVIALVIDQVDLHLQMDFKEELEKIGKKLVSSEDTVQIVMTVKSTEDTDASVQEIKKSFMESALVIRFKQSMPLIEERLIHYYYNCEGKADQKFLLLFALIKLNVIYGKTIIKVSNVFEGYKVKIFLSRIGVPAQVLNPEMPVNTQRNILQSFALSHFDYLIILGNEKGLKLRNVRNAIFFTIAANYGEYSKVVNQVSFEEGYILTLLTGPEELDALDRLQEKQREHLGGVLFAELPVKNHVLAAFSYRVKDAVKSVTPKAIKAEKSKELKKQILGSKKLKGYFEEHPQEKEIIVKELSKSKLPDYRFEDLKTIPEYLVPKEPLLTNPIEEAIAAEVKGGLAATEVEASKLFPEENPDIMNYQELPPTSGRKRWKIRHHRRLKKKPFKKEASFVA